MRPMGQRKSFTHIDNSSSGLSSLSAKLGSPPFPAKLLQFICAFVFNTCYSIWFSIQLVPGCRFLTPPKTHLSASHKNTSRQLSCLTTVQPSRYWATSNTQLRLQSLTEYDPRLGFRQA